MFVKNKKQRMMEFLLKVIKDWVSGLEEVDDVIINIYLDGSIDVINYYTNEKLINANSTADLINHIESN